MQLSDVTVYEGQNAEFTFETHREDIEVFWFINDAEVTGERYEVSSDGVVRKLVIQDTELQEDGTKVTVRFGDKETSAYLWVKDPVESISKEERHFLRFSLLCQNLGSKAVLLYFNKHVPETTLTSHLNTHRRDLHYRIGNRVWKCNREQFNILFPGPPAVAKASDFDISLIYKLIRNTINVNPPTQGWGNTPLPGDVSEEDDLERVRYYRKKLAQNTDCKIQDVDFKTMWDDLSEALERLGGNQIKSDIDCLKTKAMDNKTKHQAIENHESLPSTINRLGETWRALYKNMLEHGKETKREIRVFVVGKKGAGKTCLTRRLRSQPIDDVTDTNGIEIHSVTCKNDDQCWNEDVHTVDSRLLICTKNTEMTAKRNQEGIQKEGTKNKNKGKNLNRPDNLPKVSNQYPAHYDKLDIDLRLKTFCTKYQMEFLGSTPVNGNCFFEAISSQLRRFNINQSPEELRQNVVAYLRENPTYQLDNELVDIRDTVGDLSDYCGKMARDKEWADHVIVVTMARMLRMNIMIITSSPQATENNCMVRVDGGTGASEDKTLLLGHYWETHYQSLQPKRNQSGTPTPYTESMEKEKNTMEQENIETHSTHHDVEDSIGQDIEDMKNAQEMDVDAIRISVWDFGGDKEFYHTHPLFLVDDAVFLIVTRLDDYEDGSDCEKDVRFWFNTIHCLCKDSNTTNLKPRCIVVGTHKDKHKNEEAAYDVLIRKLDALPGKSLRNHIHGGLLLISNTEPEDKNIDDVKTAIINAAKESTEWETDHPTKFILLDKALEKRRCKHLMKPVITHLNLQSINKDLYQPLEENELKLYLFYNHSAGHLVYYEDIPEYIVIDPQWLSNLCRNFITADIFQRKLPQFLWQEFRSNGQITEALIKAIFEKQGIEDLPLQAYLMNVMEKFHMIINIPEKDADTESKRYFAPCMVKDNTIDKIYKIFERAIKEKSIWLCVNFEFLHPFVFDHIIICLCDEFTCAKHENGLPMLSSEGAVFDISPNKCEKLVFLKYKNVIQLQVLMFDKPKCQPYTYIKTLVTEKLKEFTDKYSMTINYEYKWKCPESSYASNDGLMEFTGFAEEEKYDCNVCLRLHSFQNHWEEHLTSLTKEQTNYTRLGMIVIDVVVDALYDLLPVPLPSSHEARSLKNLQRDKCDIIKLYSLHRKLNLHVPSSGWSDSSGVLYQALKDIPTTAVNVGDDIERCRLISAILNNMPHGAVDDSKTEHLYQVLHDILSRLTNCMALLPPPSYINKLETIKQKTMQLSDMEYVKEKIKAVIKVEITSGNKATISPGSTTKISAKIESDLLVSDIKVLWQRVENNIPVTLNLSAMKYAGSSTNPPLPELVINRVSQSDVGVYQIEVVSLTGSVVRSDVVIELFGESAEYSSKEEQNYQRLDKLCKDIGTKAMQMYFDRHVPKSTLVSHLNNFSANLDFNSKCRWKCTGVQYNILFPPYPAVVESCQLDITLLYKLIRNTINGINRPTKGWGPKPQTADITEEDDIERIRNYRNDMSHITDGKLSDIQFGMWWTDLSDAICRLSNNILLPDVERLAKMKLDDENFQEQLDKHEDRITSQGDMITSLKHNERISRQKPWRCNLC